ncbi:MAG: hypothetical protein EAX86_02645 [Candidatus Heimdallarchaeota archaeon]|nr:hypothetical protein [Candidatus Heimdallarchaeota archaeon]
MFHHTPAGNKKFKVTLFVLWLLMTSGVVSTATSYQTVIKSNQTQIRVVEEQLPILGGINSIRAVIGSSTIGVGYGTPSNPQSIAIFTSFSQNIAKIELKDRQGIVINRTQLITRNSFLVSLDSIIEFNDVNDDNISSSLEIHRAYRMINLSQIQFNIERIGFGPNTTEGEIHYQLRLFAEEIPYIDLWGGSSSDTLDQLVFTFDLFMRRDTIIMSSVPIISVQPVNRQLRISIDNENLTTPANRFTPRLKFSCNILGWDYSSPKSKLLLIVNSFTREDIQSLGNISGLPLNSEVLKNTNLLSTIGFMAKRLGVTTSYNMDLSERQRINFTSYRFLNNQYSLQNSLRSYLNFSWLPNVNVDGIVHPVVFQPLLSGERNLDLGFSHQVSTFYLLGGFIFPQGTEINYDPEIQLEELNPIFKFLAIPNRMLLEQSSLLILISGFLLGIVIIFRQRIRIKKQN